MRILLVKFGPIGDVVMATPIVEAVQRLHPGAALTWVVGRGLAPLLERVSSEGPARIGPFTARRIPWRSLPGLPLSPWHRTVLAAVAARRGKAVV